MSSIACGYVYNPTSAVIFRIVTQQQTRMKRVVAMVGAVLVTWRSRDINAWISNRVLCILQM